MREGGGVEEGKQSRGDSRAQQVGAGGHKSRREGTEQGGGDQGGGTEQGGGVRHVRGTEKGAGGTEKGGGVNS